MFQASGTLRYDYATEDKTTIFEGVFLMTLWDQLQPGIRLYDRLTGQERVVQHVEVYSAVVYLSFLEAQTGAVSRQPFPKNELESRFEVAAAETAFQGDAETVRLVAEAYRLRYAHLFNPAFATETSLIDLLPHQLAAVYGVKDAETGATVQPGMLDCAMSGAAQRLRFLLADDAGAGKTIMAGLVIREMLLRRMARRMLVVAPAGLVGNWQTELQRFFGLQFRIIAGRDLSDAHNPFVEQQHELAIVSVDTLARARMLQAYLEAASYDLVIFDEAHKLSATYEADLTEHKSQRYEAAEAIARQGQHLLLMTATPHMGKDEPYFFLWRLLDPTLLPTPKAFARLTPAQRQQHLLRRMKEELVTFDNAWLYQPRSSRTVQYPLNPHEQAVYDAVTLYCDTHYDRAKQRNRMAAKLALSVLQRRLASSTLAILCSLRNRERKLQHLLRELEAGLVDAAELEAQQQQLPREDIRDTTTGDEDEGVDGAEVSDLQDETLAGATEAHTAAEVRLELEEVGRLLQLAETAYALKQESKFNRLWAALEEYPDEKILIFTEFRDTLEFLVGRLEGRGLTGKIATIHGGMDYKQRQEQRAFFKDPAGARILVATDAAGEGINLQFCWLMVNYDIPWNPARIEQRMGRVHRYKQTHPVVLLNLVAANTREGKVLQVLLDKLELIRKELGDKVFDVVGLQFNHKPLQELITAAVLEGRAEEAAAEVARTLTTEQIARTLAQQQRQLAPTALRSVLNLLQQQREVAELRRMMPAYMRRFFELAAPQVGVRFQGALDGIFHLSACPAAVQRALETYPAPLRERLTFQRELAKPEWGEESQTLYLYPGEPVFDTVLRLFLHQSEAAAQRGAVFFDPRAETPYIFYLGRAALWRDAATGADSELVQEQLLGVRRYADGRMTPAPAHQLMTLLPPRAEEALAQHRPTDLVAAAQQHEPVEAFLQEQVGLGMLQAQRQAEETQLPERLRQLKIAFNLRLAALLERRERLDERAERGVPAAATKLRECQAEIAGLDAERRALEAELEQRPQRLRLGPAQLYVQALVLPLPPERAAERLDVDSERVAMDYVRLQEEALGSVVEDVSAPHLKAGFDFKIARPNGEIRYVEVKGCRGRHAIEMEANEWAQAANYRQQYWLYVVYDCDAVPELHPVCDPFATLLAKQTGAVRINVSQIVAAAAPLR